MRRQTLISAVGAVPTVDGVDAVDVAFQLSGQWLPIDHARALRTAVVQVLPWLGDEPCAGIHPIYGAASGNGWERPDGTSGALLNRSRRTPLVLRVPVYRTEDAVALCGHRLDVDGYGLTVGVMRPRSLVAAGTVRARYVVDEEEGDEALFLQRMARELDVHSVPRQQLLCGRASRIGVGSVALTVRSLLIAALDLHASRAIQSRGIGPGRLLGCGLFVPHRNIGPMRWMGDDD